MDSSIKALVRGFIAHKRSMGFSYEGATERRCLTLARFLEERQVEGSPIITRESAFEWVSFRESESSSTALSRAGLIRHLAIYLIRMGHADCYLFPVVLMPEKDDSFIPYVFTYDEIDAVTDAFDAMKPCRNSPWWHLIYPAMFRMIYGCGLRSGEALRAKVRDVDLDEGVLHVVNSKNRDSRYVPMSASLVEFLTEYSYDMGFAHRDPGDPFFPSPKGGAYTTEGVGEVFRKRFAEAGVFNQEGKPPRIYDLRHSFALHSLQAAVDRGIPEHAFLPTLAVFMGHKKIGHTEHYLHLTLEGQDRIVGIMDEELGFMFPEVITDVW